MTHESRSVAVDAQRTINWYCEQVESGQGKNRMVLYPTPGLELFTALDESPVRGIYSELGRVWAVAGHQAYEIYSNGLWDKIGVVANDSGVVTMRTNGLQGHQLFITSGGHGYIYDLNDKAFTALDSVSGFPTGQVVSGTFLDGYFIVNTSTSFQVSGLFNGLTWDGTDKAVRTVGADPVTIALQSHRELWVFGEVTSEVWVNIGDADFPLAPIAGVFIEMGCGAPHSAIRYNNMVAWLAQNRDGDRVAVISPQYQPQRVSTHAVEMAWRRYSKSSDAVSFAYQEDGHTFWVLTFPTAGGTWVYDAATQLWHERAYWNDVTGQYEAHRAICHCRCYDRHLVGDRQNGNIYSWSLRHCLDHGHMIRRLRRLPHLSRENIRSFYQRLEIELEGGLPPMPWIPQERDPLVMLRWSDDRGHTWSSEQWRSAGREGQYLARAHWERLGSARDRVFEVTVEDQIPWRLIDGYLTVEGGTH